MKRLLISVGFTHDNTPFHLVDIDNDKSANVDDILVEWYHEKNGTMVTIPISGLIRAAEAAL